MTLYECTYTAQKMKFFITDLVTFTEEIRNGKIHFLCSVSLSSHIPVLVTALGIQYFSYSCQ